jgi:hypothetical protein
VLFVDRHQSERRVEMTELEPRWRRIKHRRNCVTRKARFRDHDDVVRFLHNAANARRLAAADESVVSTTHRAFRAYECRLCKGFHVTSQVAGAGAAGSLRGSLREHLNEPGGEYGDEPGGRAGSLRGSLREHLNEPGGEHLNEPDSGREVSHGDRRGRGDGIAPRGLYDPGAGRSAGDAERRGDRDCRTDGGGA